MNNTALLVVDIQDAFEKSIPGYDNLLKRTAFAIEASKLLGIHTIYTTQDSHKLGPLHPSLLAAGLHDAPSFDKSTFSAIQAPGLQQYLTQHNIHHLLIAGLELSICIYLTALDAIKSDLHITLLSDCLAGRRKDDSHAITASLLQNSQCHRLPSETIFYSTIGSSTHPKFKELIALVKKYC